ncbi:MAG: MBOAT family protein [Butyrivibrio sp.]|nr:MBOAT family protein [Butyrivibrio sp.]
MVEVTMLFNTYGFMLLFLPVFLVAFFIIRAFVQDQIKKEAALNILIILASFVFYSFFGVRNTAVLCISLIINIIIIYRIGKSKKKKAWLIAGIAFNVVLLSFFKFSGLFFPVAISFYTFNQISYVIDLYRGEIKEFDIPDYLVYILFFPKLLQGPLEGFGSFDAGIKKAYEEELDWEKMMRGLLLLSMGLFKKVILADTFAKAVEYGFSAIPNLGRMEAILTAVFYSFQLYFDFSGYCDVATAICMMMGFDLATNFNSPYKATDIDDFWNRWHMTLTGFFTKYVYIPLGGNRKGRVRTYINVLIVFLISGIWHGSGLTFIIWGAAHGVMSVLTKMVKNARKEKKEAKDNKAVKIFAAVRKAAAVLGNYIFIMATWVFFRAETVSDAIGLFVRMAVGGPKPFYSTFADGFRLDEIWYIIKVTPIMNYNFAWDLCLWLFLAAAVIIIFFGKNAIRFCRECKINMGTTLLTAFLLLWSIISFSGVSTYLYMNF